MASAFPSSTGKRPRLTYESEVVSHDEHTSKKMTTSLCLPSSSSNAPKIKYDVFISFRGSDIRHNFLSHLLDALSHANIEVFVDYKLREGDELSQALCRAIEESLIVLVVFSKDYASSKWCLEELVKINECRTKNGLIVIPIFYNVDPSDVRYQKGCYENAFAKYEELFKDNMMKVEKWIFALNEVANILGFHSSSCRSEHELIKVVTDRVLTRLKNMYQSLDLKGLVGIDKPIADLESLMSRIKSEDVGVIGIWGMGGLGKTTIAGALFNRLYSEFEVCCFQSNVREETEKCGIPRVKSKLISILLEEKEDPNTGIPDNGVPAYVLRRLQRKKVLVVLDDVNDSNQIESLIGGHDWLGGGSRIIVTTRDKHVMIEANAGNYTYEVEALRPYHALQLLKIHAFSEQYPQRSWHDELMMKVVEYAQGIPLALKVLGKFLCGKTAEEWEDQLQKLHKMPFPKIQNVLRLSYEGLEYQEQCIFLYIACFFEEGEPKARVQYLLGECGYAAKIALKTLEDRALIRTAMDGIYMHDLIREMGRGIVREKGFDKPGQWKHLWDLNDICRVLKHHEGTENIESINLNLQRVGDLSLSPHCFDRMVNLKFLRFRIDNPFGDDTKIEFHSSEGFEIRSSNIRLFDWDYYPLKSFPMTFNAENLVELQMKNSCVTKLWDGVQNLPNLEVMNLWHSYHLVELPDLSKATRLRYLCLSTCKSLVSIHPSILSLLNLTDMNLEHSKKLVGLPDLFETSSLKNIYLTSSDNLVSVHSSILFLPNVEMVELSLCPRFEEFSGIEALPSSATFHSKLRDLRLNGCVSLKHLPDSMSKLTSLDCLRLDGCKELDTSNLQIIFDGLHSLTYLYMDGCYKLYELPENINKLSFLRILSLRRTNVKSLPESIKHLSHLKYLYLNKCIRLQSIPELPPSLIQLTADDCTSLERVSTLTHQLLQPHITWAIQNYYFFKTKFSFSNCPNLR